MQYFNRSIIMIITLSVMTFVASGANALGSGSTYIFDLSGGTWSETSKLTTSDGAVGDDDGSNSGSAYIITNDLIYKDGFE